MKISDSSDFHQCAENTDVQVFVREGSEELPSASVAITKGGAIAVNVGGYVYVKSVDEWFKLAGGKWPVTPKEQP